MAWCEKRDLNPYGESTRPSNVRVYQFRHSRFSLTVGGIQALPLQRILLYTILLEMSIPFLKKIKKF